ncbi:hypothetical protein [Agrobacterium radiobacter]|jgi:hypothetical protein|uniref:hypothetical protein n=1 Tax=Agrobacterium radiobacter TaxID=362 RepID=UPI000DD2F12B|nr:hypothetical protein [Agrobacterium radiobacter]MBB4408666.1 hypothetical protein [Agrobacterium radiobacter]MBB4454362.1 hypothetical protein [Agrobacterium radiobacter]
MSAIDRIGSTASLYTRPRPQDVSQAVPNPAPELSASLIGGGAAPSLSSNLANALWSLRGQEGRIDETPLKGGGTGSDEEELSRWANMSLGEKIRAQYLEARGLSEGDLAAMPPDERKAIEDEIQKAIRVAMEAPKDDDVSVLAGL